MPNLLDDDRTLSPLPNLFAVGKLEDELHTGSARAVVELGAV